MRLFVAEKPSLARAIADALPAPQRRSRTHIECGAHDVVAWCAGHILQPVPPEAYGEGYKTWRLDALPIAPTDWKLQVTTPELYRAIARLLQSATRVVHAGDPDREGQLLVDEVLAHAGYRGPVDRLLIRDLSPERCEKRSAHSSRTKNTGPCPTRRSRGNAPTGSTA
jgi:DNA topoisomerase-3